LRHARAQAALVFAQQQAARYQALAKDGLSSVQNAQQYTSQLHQQEAAAETAVGDLKLAERQVASLKAQRMSAEASLAQANAPLR
jgi:multidrug resistance efflux pump